MAVPKRKKSKSNINNRRIHQRVAIPNRITFRDAEMQCFLTMHAPIAVLIRAVL